MTTDNGPLSTSQTPPAHSTTSPAPTTPSSPPPHPGVLQRNPSTSSSVSGSFPSRHQRPQNVAELHQELEREQEGVVNRLLGQITRVAQTVAATHPGTTPDDV